MTKIFSVILTLFVLGSIYSCNKSEINSDQTTSTFDPSLPYSYKINFVPAKTNSELEELRLKSSNIIKNQTQLEKIIKNEKTPFSRLSPEILQEFKETIVFREGVGVVGFNYKIIMDNLSENDYITITSYFGIDSKYGYWYGASALSNPNARQALEDHNGYYCKYKGTCESRSGYICLNGC